jgi:hypothetical protein
MDVWKWDKLILITKLKTNKKEKILNCFLWKILKKLIKWKINLILLKKKVKI